MLTIGDKKYCGFNALCALPKNPYEKAVDMHVGMLTAPFGSESLETVAKFAGEAGFVSLEVVAGPGSNHIDPAKFDDAEKARIQKILDDNGLEISSLCHYGNVNEPGQSDDIIAHFKKTIDASVALGVDVVCGLAGHPVEGKSKAETITEIVPIVYKPVCQYAADKGVKIALENWFATCIQHLGLFDLLFETISDENFGLNFDPSHLIRMGIDPVRFLEEFTPHVYHAHAKDTEILEENLYEHGHSQPATFPDADQYRSLPWRYTLPGHGIARWGRLFDILKTAEYRGALCIEHEDENFTGTDEIQKHGFIAARDFLTQT